MNKLKPQPTLVDQVYEAILSDITEGKFDNLRRLKQEEIAESLDITIEEVKQSIKNNGRHLSMDAPLKAFRS